MIYRDYQIQLDSDINDAWKLHRNVLAVLPTGGGKTCVFSKIVQERDKPACVTAHRQELVSQISLALSRNDVNHRIIGQSSVIKNISKLQYEEFGKIYITPNSPIVVAGVDTLLRRVNTLHDWRKKVDLWVQDEAHHVLRSNKWGKTIKLFPNAYGLGVTATPERADGKGLGIQADGVFHTMVTGPTMRELISRGYLTEYRIFAPQSNLDLTNVEIGSTGDYKQPQVSKAVRKSTITGDVVNHYLRIAPGKLGITFAVDIQHAEEIAKQFNDKGVSAVIVTGNTSDYERAIILRKFKNRQYLQLINVDLFGEGFDVPAVEVVSFARPTQSYGLYVQQFGRVLRLREGKQYGIIIDHVGNVIRHGLPDAFREWSLFGREKQTRSTNPDAIPLRNCVKCWNVYERIYKCCPYCGYYPEPTARGQPQFVDGDLTELDPLTLSHMRGEIARIDLPIEQYKEDLKNKHVPYIGQKAHAKRHLKRQDAQQALRGSIAYWAGKQRSIGLTDSESYRKFYFLFGTDVLTAQTLNYDDALILADRVNEDLIK